MELRQFEEAIDHSFQPTRSTSEKLEDLNEDISKYCLHHYRQTLPAKNQLQFIKKNTGRQM